VYCCPSARAAGSVHCSEGASKFRLVLRRMKLLPLPLRTLSCPPLKPPRLTSYGAVTSDVETCASRGSVELPRFAPFSVMLF
jgi:hypothetical protein